MTRSPQTGIIGSGGHHWAAFSELGARQRNEDRWDLRQGPGGITLWVLADGVGGHDDGDVAAEVGVKAFLDTASAHGDPEIAVRKGIAAAREAVGALRGEGVGDRAPSSTLVGLAMLGRTGFVCHAGDSVLFQFRNGRLIHRTRDHNVRELKRAVSGLAPLSAADDPDASKLTRSLGGPLEENMEDTVSRLKLRQNDLLLLCSDGISQQIPEDDPGAWAAGARDEVTLLDLARQTVVAAKNPRQDNYTAVAIRVGQIDLGAGGAWFQSYWPLLTGALVFVVLVAALTIQGVLKDDNSRPAQYSPDPDPARNALAPLIDDAGKTTDRSVDQTGPAAVESVPLPPLVVSPKRPCRTVYETHKECTVEQRTTSRCRRDTGVELKYENSWPINDSATTQSEAERICRVNAHDFVRPRFREECDSTLGDVTIRCDCAWGDGTAAIHRCLVAARAQCHSIREVCEEVTLPLEQCHPVQIKREVCD